VSRWPPGGKAAPWLALAAGALACALALRPVTRLEIENTARARSTLLAPGPGGAFAVTSIQSMYDVPVTESFTVDDGGRLRLAAVESRSAAAREYLGLTGPGDRQAVAREWPELVFRIATGLPQRLEIGSASRSFLDFGAPGDRLVLRAIRRPAALLLALDR
jgi:hypothetical protein